MNQSQIRHELKQLIGFTNICSVLEAMSAVCRERAPTAGNDKRQQVLNETATYLQQQADSYAAHKIIYRPVHDPGNPNCPRNADPANETCGCIQPRS